MVPVTGQLVKLPLCHIRGFGKLPAAARLLVLYKALEYLYYFGALRQEYRQSLTYNINRGKELKLSAELIVVALFCLFKHIKVRFKLACFRKSGAVNAAEHFLVRIAAPVSAGSRSQLKRLYRTRAH